MMNRAVGTPNQAGLDSLVNWAGISHVVIHGDSPNVKEFVSRYASSFPDPGRLLVFGVGVVPVRKQIVAIGKLAGFRKVLLVFPGDLLGRIATIKIAVWLNGKDVLITYVSGGVLQVTFKGKVYEFPEHIFSLSAFEKASGFRSGIRCKKVPEDF